MPRVYIPSYGPDPSTVRTGLAWLAQRGRPALIAVSQKSNLDGVIKDVIGDGAMKVLAKGDPLSIGGVQAILLTERDRRLSWNGTILAIYPSRKLLDKIDALHVDDVLVIPWTEDEVRYWIDTWSAQSILATSDPADSPIPLAPVVEAALRDLTGRINLSTGLAHPHDRSSAIELFEILRDADVRFTPEAVRAWLVAHGRWQPDHANNVESVCLDVLAGKRLRCERGRWPDALRRWEASGSGPSE
jgi:hypothetical protein